MRSAVFCLVVVCWAVGSSDALAPVSRNLALRGGGYNRKTFGLGSCLQDHVDVVKILCRIHITTTSTQAHAHTCACTHTTHIQIPHIHTH